MKKLISILLILVLTFGVCQSVMGATVSDVYNSNTIISTVRTVIPIHVEYLRNGILWRVSLHTLWCYESGDHLVVDGYTFPSTGVTHFEKIILPTVYEGKGIMFEKDALAGLPVKEIVFTEGIHTIPEGLCRDNTLLEKVVIPSSVTEIGDYAFKGCTSLRDGGVVYAESIGVEAFSGCTKLNMVLNNPKRIGERAFEGCENVTGLETYLDFNVKFVDGEVTVGGITYALKNEEVWITKCDKMRQGEVIIPSEVGGYKVTQIVYPGFYDCGQITKVVLPETMKSVGTWVFWNCNNLMEIELNEGLEAIGTQAFEYCRGLKEIKIPDTVKTINDMAFRGSGIESVKIGNAVTFIGDGAFWDCDKLTRVNVPDSVKILGTDEGLYASGYFGGVQTDKKLSPFYGCDMLTSVSIGKGVEKIYPDTFFDCIVLSDINVSAENENYASVGGVLYTKDMKKLLCVPKGKNYSMYTIPEGVSEIGEKALSNAGLTTLYMPDTATNIHGENIIPEKTIKYEKIEDVPEEARQVYPVSGVYNRISWNLESGVLTLTGQGVISERVDGVYTPVPWKAESVAEIVIGEGIEGIQGVFKNHTNLKKVILPKSMKEISDLSFYNCRALESVIIPEGVVKIGVMAFGECYSLTDVKVLSTMEVEICQGAFDIAPGAIIYLPDTANQIDKFAFTHIYSTGANQMGTNSRPQDVTVVVKSGSHAQDRAKEIGVKVRTPYSVGIGENYLIGDNVYEENKVVYVSGKAAFEALGITVDCDDDKKIAVCGAGNDWMIFNNANRQITTAKGIVEVEKPARWINGMFMVPTDVLEKLGFNNVTIVEESKLKSGQGGELEEAIDGAVKIRLDKFTVSQIPEAQNGPYNMLDKNVATRWSAEVTDEANPCWAIFDLGDTYKLDKIGLAFYRDSIRTTEFSVEVSVDGAEYVEAIGRRSSYGGAEAMGYYALDGIEARYVRLSGYGNSSPYSNIKNWFSPSEVEIYKVAEGPVLVSGAEASKLVVGVDGKVDLKSATVTASIISEPENGPSDIYDANLSTYCVLYVQDQSNPQYIQIDLGEVKDIARLALAFRMAKQRTTFFDIRVSEDGENFVTVVPRQSSDMRVDTFENFGINRKARYIRIYGYTNTFNKYWVSISEAEVYLNK